MIKKALPRPLRLSLLINGYSGVFAILLFIFGLFLSFNFLRTFDFQAFLYLQDDIEIGEGEITGVFETNTQISEEYVYAYDYVFHSPIGDLNWTSYGHGFNYEVGDKVKIEYNADKPDVNRIKGMNNDEGNWAFLFPLLGALGWITYNYIVGRKSLKIAQNGKLAEGSLISKKATITEVNDRRVYKLTFSFSTEDGKSYKVVTKTHRPEILEDDIKETLIYDKDDPSKARMLDSLPWKSGKLIREFYG